MDYSLLLPISTPVFQHVHEHVWGMWGSFWCSVYLHNSSFSFFHLCAKLHQLSSLSSVLILLLESGDFLWQDQAVCSFFKTGEPAVPQWHPLLMHILHLIFAYVPFLLQNVLIFKFVGVVQSTYVVVSTQHFTQPWIGPATNRRIMWENG